MIKFIYFGKRGKFSLAAFIVMILVSSIALFGSLNGDFTTTIPFDGQISSLDSYIGEMNFDFKSTNSFDIIISETDKQLRLVKLTGFVIGDIQTEGNDIKIYLKDKEGNNYNFFEEEESKGPYVSPIRSLFIITGLVSDKSKDKTEKKSKGKNEDKKEGKSPDKGKKEESLGEGKEEKDGESPDKEKEEKNEDKGKEGDKKEESSDKGKIEASLGEGKEEKDGESQDRGKEEKNEDKGKDKTEKKDENKVEGENDSKRVIKLSKKPQLIGEILKTKLEETNGDKKKSETFEKQEVSIDVKIDEELVLEKRDVSYKSLEKDARKFVQYVKIPEGADISKLVMVVEVNGIEVIIKDLSFIFE